VKFYLGFELEKIKRRHLLNPIVVLIATRRVIVNYKEEFVVELHWMTATACYCCAC